MKMMIIYLLFDIIGIHSILMEILLLKRGEFIMTIGVNNHHLIIMEK